MKDLFEILDASKKELEALSPMKSVDSDRLWRKFRLEWNYNSNHLEGNTLTYQETELVLIFDQAPGGHTVREIEEMKAHDVAIALVRDWALDTAREISESDIRTLNQTLLVRPFWKEAITPDGQPVRRLIKIGAYKELPNSVRLPNGELFAYAEPHEVDSKMGDLMAWYRKAAKKEHPAFVAAKLHYDFVCIHPFDDGNGRIARLLMNYHLFRCGFAPVIIKSEGKRAYLSALNRADVGDFEAFVQYIGEQMLWSMNLTIRASKGESIEEEGDWGKQISLLKRAVVDQKTKAEQEKSRYEDLITDWLVMNAATVIQEMENRIGVFREFFKATRFQIQTQANPGNEVIQFEDPILWQGLPRILRRRKHMIK